MTGSALSTWLGASYTANSGETVTETSAMRVSPFFAGVRLLSETIAHLPLILYERMDRGKRRATEHPLYAVLHDLPNPYMTAMELRENMVAHMIMWGNAYCEVVRDGAGRVRELWPLRPDRVSIVTDSANQTWLEYTKASGEIVPFRYEDLWHPRGFSLDRYSGMSVLSQARQTLGTIQAAGKGAGKFFANDSRPGGILTTDKSLRNKDTRDNIKESWEALHKGSDNKWRVAILEEGLHWEQIGMPPKDAQFLETRQFEVTEICRWLRISHTSWRTWTMRRSVTSNTKASSS